jgi:threonine/homoserine/homoserine lactone efflux protein
VKIVLIFRIVGINCYNKGFMQGFLISVSNPKVILYCILPTILDLNSLTTADIALASALTLVGLMLGLMLIAISLLHPPDVFSSLKVRLRV